MYPCLSIFNFQTFLSKKEMKVDEALLKLEITEN